MSEQHHPSPKGQPSAEDKGTAAGQDELAEQLSALARSLQASHADPDQILDEVVSAAIALIPGVEEGSISVVMARRTVTSQHA